MIEPGNEMAGDGNRLLIYRDQVTHYTDAQKALLAWLLERS